jgi:hypothetical protein
MEKLICLETEVPQHSCIHGEVRSPIKLDGVAATLWTYTREALGCNLGRITAILTVTFLWFSSVATDELRDNTSIWPRALPSKSFPMLHSTISLCSELLGLWTLSVVQNCT